MPLKTVTIRFGKGAMRIDLLNRYVLHLLVEYPPHVSISKLVNSLKGVSSRLIRADRPEIKGNNR